MATQICDRTITYRNFDYNRAETIIQEEEYLEDEDFDDIRFYRRHGNIIDDIEKAKEKYTRNSNEDIFTTLNETHHREKRNNFLTASFWVNALPIIKQNIVRDYFYVDPPEPIKSLLDLGNPFGGFTCIGKEIDYGSGSTALSDRYIVNFPCILLKIFIISTWCMVTGCFTPPPIDPPEVPRCPADPNCPITNNPENVLDLVPPGLIPVATFPPFNPPGRSVPAVAVIFEERPGTLPGERPPDDGRDGTDFRKKRHASYCPQKSFLDKFLLNLRCYKERMKAKYKQNSHGKNFDINHS